MIRLDAEGFIDTTIKVSKAAALMFGCVLLAQTIAFTSALQRDHEAFREMCRKAEVSDGACAMLWRQGSQPVLVEQSAARSSRWGV